VATGDLIAGQLLQCMKIHKIYHSGNWRSNSWTIVAVYEDTQDISQWQLATPIAGQLMQCMEIQPASGQIVTVAAGPIGTMPCMKLHRICHSGKWQLW